jgi:hypothetical protein
MYMVDQKLPKTDGEDWFLQAPSPAVIESTLMDWISILQKYGVLCTITCVVMFYFFYKISKIRKNQVFAKFWMVTSWGMVVLTVIFIILPYIVLAFY